jgi:hypothetical protein
MKRNLIATFALAVAAMVATTPATLAQQSQTKANVPFQFHVGHTSLAAGTYVIKAESGSKIEVLDRQTGHEIMALGNAETERNAGNPRLVFHRYGSKYFLAEIWAGGGQGMVLPKTRQEQEYLASAQNAEPEQTVMLAMN